MGDAGRLDGPDLLEPHLRVPEVVEEASTVAAHHRDDVELELDQTAAELNGRPRQTLGWSKPAEKMNELLLQ